MRLLNTDNLGLTEFVDHNIPPYAILSHRWEDDEISYQDLNAVRNRNGAGFAKIKNSCDKASAHGLSWIWIDTCCIDKSSSAELSEAINAMFKWYKSSTRCYAYLSDVHGIEDGSGSLRWHDFRKSAWFTRGWTLQELIAPSDVIFFDSAWREIGTRTQLAKDITAAALIPDTAFESLRPYSVAQKMSWASRRQTSRVEDLAYCLLGLFDVVMPIIYGEGERAFTRLQEEIIKTSDDETIFTWSINEQDEASALKKLQEEMHIGMGDKSIYALPSEHTGTGNLFAPMPSCFLHGGNFHRDQIAWRPPYTLTHKGLRMSAAIFGTKNQEEHGEAMIPLNCTYNGISPVAMRITPPIGDAVLRTGCVVLDGVDTILDGETAVQLGSSIIQVMRESDLCEVYIRVKWPDQPVISNLARDYAVATTHIG